MKRRGVVAELESAAVMGSVGRVVRTSHAAA